MDAKIIGLLGTALSALIAALGYYAKTKHERQRATRTVLFYLLELHHLLSRIQFSVTQFPSEYAEKCRSVLHKKGLPFTDVEAKVLGDALEPLVRQMALSEMDQLASEVVEPFTRTLAELSREDPLLAFQLKGKESITKASKLVRTFVPDGMNEGHGDAAHPITEAFLSNIDDFIRQITVNELASAIRSVAWRCGFFTLIKCYFLLRRASQMNLLSELDGQFLPIIDEIVSQAVAAQITSPAPVSPGSLQHDRTKQ